MNENHFEITTPDNADTEREPIWQTLAGCAVFWAGFLTLYWML